MQETEWVEDQAGEVVVALGPEMEPEEAQVMAQEMWLETVPEEAQADEAGPEARVNDCVWPGAITKARQKPWD